ncbi:hypothetical protein HNR44_001917 [Geomicrobium halophilum]|uniref:Uncharacterized protein n=1 Tax=Geomicrobium halophilum TaxID=549000 RepID=A0A841PMH8_9BACL|nr:hypothetical protein [Geomicrobium halophilum]MBB6449939.1 hypothetical protein [Geomicrobium halophilum]
MVDTFLDIMLGPLRTISDFYFENQMIFNTMIVGFALYKMIGKRKQPQEEAAN